MIMIIIIIVIIAVSKFIAAIIIYVSIFSNNSTDNIRMNRASRQMSSMATSKPYCKANSVYFYKGDNDVCILPNNLQTFVYPGLTISKEGPVVQ